VTAPQEVDQSLRIDVTWAAANSWSQAWGKTKPLADAQGAKKLSRRP
jgi:hypothetical protein